MRLGLALLAIALLLTGMAACGASDPTTSHGYLKKDGDAEGDDGPPHGKGVGDDLPFLNSYGAKADLAQAQAIAALVTSYYTAASTDNAAKACSLLASGLARGLAEAESSQHGGESCATALSPIFEKQHPQLIKDDVPTMVVTTIRVKGDTALAVLGFQAEPEADVLLQREGSRWKMDTLLATVLT
jgi:hypothetical protein